MAEPQQKQQRDRNDRRPRREEEENDGLIDKLVSINRVSKTVKGGRTMRFSALVIVGDQKGRVGCGHGKAREVPEAIDKATKQAKRSLFRVPMREGRTLHHDLTGRFGAGKVILRAAPAGTGIIAGGPMRAVFEALGIGDVVSKSVGTSNPHNMVKATLNALRQASSPRQIAARRGVKVGALLTARDGAAKSSDEAKSDETKEAGND
ncbi:MAG TPA: 30S ribosomal protein S5 [Alphaproteobacteria bacterium]|nr:30S ribosomal protein S5 [Rhodospirillaceae bacterium]HRJ11822.1 30S ribosomal protein S5 [Alphaproteobacteria bacterium]